jgi:hypothetical protein
LGIAAQLKIRFIAVEIPGEDTNEDLKVRSQEEICSLSVRDQKVSHCAAR